MSAQISTELANKKTQLEKQSKEQELNKTKTTTNATTHTPISVALANQNQKHKEELLLSKKIEIDKTTGLVLGIAFYPAPYPNSEDRANPSDVSLLVIHDTEIVAPDDVPYDKSVVHYMFTKQYDKFKVDYAKEHARIFPTGTRDVAAHIVIRRSGEMIQYVSFNRLGHHAGVSAFENRDNCNEFSIGIELEGFANRQDFLYTEPQYHQLASLTAAIMQSYPSITLQRITGHEDIARPIGRKTDPGPTFDWVKYRSLIQKYQDHSKNHNTNTVAAGLNK